MYVNIPKHLGRCNPIDWYGWWIKFRYDKYTWGIDDSELTKFDLFIQKITDKLQDFANETINPWFFDKRKRNIKVRIDDYDCWGVDYTAAVVLTPLLKRYKEYTTGLPWTDPEDAPHIGKGESTGEGWDDSKAEERWNWIIDEMIYAFESTIDEDWENQFYSRSSYRMNDEQKKAFDKAWERRLNGLRLFGKYFHKLWD